MATQGTYRAETFVSGEAITANHFVTLESDGFVDMADAAGERAIGVALAGATAAGKAIPVALEGRVKVKAGGTIAAGAAVSAAADAEVITATTGHIVMGYAVDGAAAGDVVTIELIQGGNASA